MTTVPGDAHESVWRGRLFLGSGWLVYAGPVGPTTPHAHHAFQIVSSSEGVLLQGAQDPVPVACHQAIIPCDTTHTTIGVTSFALLVYVEPDTRTGRALHTVINRAVQSAVGWAAAGQPLSSMPQVARPRTWDEARATADLLIETLARDGVRRAPVHPAVRRAMALIAASDHELRLPVVAETIGVSESRLSHLFSESVGVPFRVYALWRRLQRAAAALADGASITDAAHGAGFADGPHLTRTFRRMFGIAPSEVAGVADWIADPHPAGPLE